MIFDSFFYFHTILVVYLIIYVRFLWITHSSKQPIKVAKLNHQELISIKLFDNIHKIEWNYNILFEIHHTS